VGGREFNEGLSHIRNDVPIFPLIRNAVTTSCSDVTQQLTRVLLKEMGERENEVRGDGGRRGGGLGSRPIFKKFNEPYAPS